MNLSAYSATSAVNHVFMEKPRLVAIVGPTAAGKSSLALGLAQQFSGEIISADSVQVYRGLDIGTAKPSLADRRIVPHHLIDIINPDQDYSAALFRRQAGELICILHERQKPIFVVGGTGLYLKALTRGLFRGPAANTGFRARLNREADTKGNPFLHHRLQELDPEAAARIHPQDRMRIVRALEVHSQSQRKISEFQEEHRFQEAPYEVFKIGPFFEREELYRRIETRTEEMMERGWVEEVKTLLDQGYLPHLKSLQSLGYKHIVSYLSGKISLEEAVRLIKRDTRRYAKRQITWFKSDPEIAWFSSDPESRVLIERKVASFLKGGRIVL